MKNWALCNIDAEEDDPKRNEGCADTHVCVRNIWMHTGIGEYDAGFGCAWKQACKGTATWEYYDGGLQHFQYFCSKAQTDEANAEDLPMPYEAWTMAAQKYHPETWEPACNETKQCNKVLCIGEGECEDKRLDCREYFYEIDSDRNSWDRGNICVNDWFKVFCADGR